MSESTVPACGYWLQAETPAFPSQDAYLEAVKLDVSAATGPVELNLYLFAALRVQKITRGGQDVAPADFESIAQDIMEFIQSLLSSSAQSGFRTIIGSKGEILILPPGPIDLDETAVQNIANSMKDVMGTDQIWLLFSGGKTEKASDGSGIAVTDFVSFLLSAELGEWKASLKEGLLVFQKTDIEISMVVLQQLAPPLSPQLNFSVPEIRASPRRLPTRVPPYDGAEVIVGVADYGCDFVHGNFRHSGGATRLLSLWDQNVPPPGWRPDPTNPPARFGYGREFTAAAVNGALAPPDPFKPDPYKRDPYQLLGYDPHDNYVIPGPVDAAHGTHVLDIATGNGRSTRAAGVAPGADLVFVQIRPSDLIVSPQRRGATEFGPPLDRTLANFVFDALCYIFLTAQNAPRCDGRLGKPAVVNLSLVANRGPRDGTSPLEQAIDMLLGQPGRAVVVAAGNARKQRWHASGRVSDTQPRTLTWKFFPEDVTRSFLEIWYASPGGQLNVTLIAPDGHRLGLVMPDQVYSIYRDWRRIGFVTGSRTSRWNGNQQILIALMSSQIEAKIEEKWGIELSIPGAGCVDFHAWIDRDYSGGSRFAKEDADPSHTLSALACGNKTIVVGAYDAVLPKRNAEPESAAGPTRDFRRKPEVSAPGRDVRAARSKGGQPIPGSPWRTAAATVLSGTSMAAPHVAGLIALLLQKKPGLPIDDIRKAVISTVRRDPPRGTADDVPPGDLHDPWDPVFGFGRVDAAAAIKATR